MFNDALTGCPPELAFIFFGEIAVVITSIDNSGLVFALVVSRALVDGRLRDAFSDMPYGVSDVKFSIEGHILVVGVWVCRYVLRLDARIRIVYTGRPASSRGSDWFLELGFLRYVFWRTLRFGR